MPLDDSKEREMVNLAGFQVTKAELFAHTKEPAITVWGDKIKFNMACLRRFPGVTHIQLLIHTDQKRLIIKPCDSDAPDSLRWSNGGGEKEIRNRDMVCKLLQPDFSILCSGISTTGTRCSASQQSQMMKYFIFSGFRTLSFSAMTGNQGKAELIFPKTGEITSVCRLKIMKSVTR